jgi:hypothetical protein
MKFLAIDGDLLKNTSLNPTDKLICSFLFNLSKAGKGYWGSYEYLSGEFGLRTDYLEQRFIFLEQKGIIHKNEVGWFLKMPFWEICNFGG